MAVSKHRKTSHKRAHPRVVPKLIPTVSWSKKLHSSRLMFLKDDPDFEAMVKIGRVMNTIAFCVTDVHTYGGQKTHTETRQYRRAGYLLGGYVHQARVLARTYVSRYKKEPAFKKLKMLVSDQEKHKQVWAYARTIRNNIAFHMDEENKTTRNMLAELKPGAYTVMSGDDMAYINYYFEFADFIDMAFLVDEFADGRTWEETTEDIFKSLMDYAMELVKACHEFQQMLWDTKFGQHVY